MINATRAARLIECEDVLDDVLDFTPTIADDPDIIALLDEYEEDLIRNGDL